MATINMLEETANYLLNHCFVLGGVEDQRAKYLYVQDHLDEVRAVFAPLGYSVLLYPAPLQAAALVNGHEGSQARLLKYESILLLVLRLLYLQKRESLAANAVWTRKRWKTSCAPCAGTIWRGLWGGFPGWTAALRYFPLCCWPCRMPTLRTPPPRAGAPAQSLAFMNDRKKQGRVKNDRTQTAEAYQLAQL